MLEDTQLTKFYINLSRRKREVLQLVSAEYSNPEIAKRLCIEPCVVAEHLTEIYGDLATLDGVSQKPRRYTVIRLYSGFFERHPDLSCF